ncbi:MAG: TetR/AcrR family transcriptional regulator [Gemmatimonadota bacterium]|nr:TetR/AcrR family transcriptional regulator [Gemmatimonadota bacterium]MDH5760645.1 TetR/AcrR family transcriptional regulator [Gemmatimonadota bacterium]
MNQFASSPTDTATALIEAGRFLFSRKGYDGASVRDITSTAGANLGAITYHFGSKRAFYEIVLTETLRPLVDRVGAAATGEGSALDRIEAVVDTFFDHLARYPELPRLLLQEVTAGRHPPAEVIRILQRNAAYLGGLVQEGQEDGSIRTGHPFLMAISVVSQPVYLSLIAPLVSEVAGVDLANPVVRGQVALHVKSFARAALERRDERIR